MTWSSACLNNIPDNLPRDSITHSDMDAPTSIISQKNASIDLLIVQSDEDISSTEVLSSQKILACIKLTKS